MEYSRYSIYRPINKINKKKSVENSIYILNLKNEKIKGISKLISMSKIKNIKLIKKKWILKGMRLLFIGSNPHSKGEIFSRL